MHELILIIDDNPKILAGVKMRLEMGGYQVLLAYDGRQALDLLKHVVPHLIVADIMMPRMTGWELFEQVRADSRLMSIPFIFLTARTDDDSIQRGKRLGAEDYLTKPFKAEELEATIRGRLLRAAQLNQQSLSMKSDPTGITTISTGDLTIDLKSHRVFIGAEEIFLSPIEFHILTHLCKKAGEVSSLEELAEVSYTGDYTDWDAKNTLRVHIKNLRKKLADDPSDPRYIVNVRGVGYRLEYAR